jgi:hypothetical protein
MELADGGIQIGGAKIGPHAPGEDEFGISALPEQKVAEALFAAGADEQVNGRAQLLFQAFAADQPGLGGVA